MLGPCCSINESESEQQELQLDTNAIREPMKRDKKGCNTRAFRLTECQAAAAL